MKKMLLTNWHTMRFVRFVFALFLIFQAFETKQWLFLGMAVFFLFQAVFNQGCNANGCTITTTKLKKNE